MKNQGTNIGIRTAFSLMELSIVIVIIGLLLAGVVGSKHILKKARINSAQSITRSSPLNSTVGNKLWLESSLAEISLGKNLSTGDSIFAWKNSTNSQNSSSVVSVGSGPTYSNSINHIQAIRFDSSSHDNHLEIANPEFLNDTDYTIFILDKRMAVNSANGGNYLVGDGSGFSLGYESPNKIIQTHGEAASDDNQASIESINSYSNKPRMISFTHSAIDGNKIYINGTLANEDSSPEAKTHLSGFSSSSTLKIGKNYNGEIGEIAIFNRDIKQVERREIENYLTDKWRAPNNRDRNSSCINGIITANGCEQSCSAPNVNGITSSTTISDGSSKSYACDDTGYKGNTPTYSCSNGSLSPTPNISDCVSNNCDVGYIDSGSNSCVQSCNVATIHGSSYSGGYVADGVNVTCDQTGYTSSHIGTCSLGADITGSCACDVSNNYTDSNSDGICEASCIITSANSSLSTDIEVLSGSNSYDCANQSGYVGTLSYTCNDGTVGTIATSCIAQNNPFTSTWLTTTNNETITLPLTSGTHSFYVDWGDGSGDMITSYNQSEITHNYAAAGSHIVNIYGTMNGWSFNGAGDKDKITNISNWGNMRLGNQGSYFKGCSNLTITATDILDTTLMTKFVSAFEGASSLTTVPNMGSWDMSSATNLSRMFLDAANFNEDISSWNVSNVDDAFGIFLRAYKFNQDISSWNVSKMVDMRNMFSNATSFNQDLSVDVNGWNIDSVTNMASFLKNVTLSTANYNKLLHKFANQTPPSNITFSGGNSKYDSSSGGVNGTAARNTLTSTYNWTITDGGDGDSINCTGGDEDSTSLPGYKMHIFTSSGTLNCTSAGNAEILVVAGGGGGGGCISGGGGAGGVIYEASYSLSVGNTDVTVGDGGNGGNGWNSLNQHGKKGGNSEFGTLIAIGGGGGADHRYSPDPLPNDGGSGGGDALHNIDAGGIQDNGTGTTGQGNHGGACGSPSNCYDRAGGGGGAGSDGFDSTSSKAGNGGTGVDYGSIFSTNYGDSGWFASGGGGGTRSSKGSAGTASQGGGGNGSINTVGATNALANTGGGGGGAGYNGINTAIVGGSGGSGIVIIKYPN